MYIFSIPSVFWVVKTAFCASQGYHWRRHGAIQKPSTGPAFLGDFWGPGDWEGGETTIRTARNSRPQV